MNLKDKTPKEKQLAAYAEFERIQMAIEELKDFRKVKGTYQWIKLFDEMFGYAELTGYLITRLNEKEL